MYRLFDLASKLLLPCALSILLAPAAIASESTELQALQAEVAELRARVERLERDLTDGIAINPALEEILGAPQRTKTIKKHVLWYYGDGKVTFYLRRLKSFEKPRF